MRKHADLIYDVGLNNGDDTAYYLRRGYRVVAIDADPLLCENATRRFAEAIDAGRLTILNLGISASRGCADFWVNEACSEWSSFDYNVASRDNLPHHAIQVTCVTFDEVLEEYGVPHYLKTDIEGNDIYCLKVLSPDCRPDFISVEMGTQEMLDEMKRLGYTHFKLIDQSTFLPLEVPEAWSMRARKYASALIESRSLRARAICRLVGWRRIADYIQKSRRRDSWEFPMGSSGPFGEDTSGKWLTAEKVYASWQHYLNLHQRDASQKAYAFWCDLHAAL
ncbi:FkbM family methyltransferase [bacterium]|nr:MAG: FkbM family methyltransferase [bacterium]